MYDRMYIYFDPLLSKKIFEESCLGCLLKVLWGPTIFLKFAFKAIGTRTINNVIISNLDINPLSSKFDDLKVLVTGIFDILLKTETKLDNTFPDSLFQIDGFFTQLTWDRHSNGSGVVSCLCLASHHLQTSV